MGGVHAPQAVRRGMSWHASNGGTVLPFSAAAAAGLCCCRPCLALSWLAYCRSWALCCRVLNCPCSIVFSHLLHQAHPTLVPVQDQIANPGPFPHLCTSLLPLPLHAGRRRRRRSARAASWDQTNRTATMMNLPMARVCRVVFIDASWLWRRQQPLGCWGVTAVKLPQNCAQPSPSVRLSVPPIMGPSSAYPHSTHLGRLLLQTLTSSCRQVWRTIHSSSRRRTPLMTHSSRQAVCAVLCCAVLWCGVGILCGLPNSPGCGPMPGTRLSV